MHVAVGQGRRQAGAAVMSTALHLMPLMLAGLVLGPVDVLKSSLPPPGGGGGGVGGSSSGGGGRQRYAGLGSVGWDVQLGIWSMAWEPFLLSLEEGIATVATLLTMTMHGDAVAREKDCASYRALFRDLEGCGSYVRDVGYRTPDGGWLVESNLNLLPYDVGDLPRTTMLMGGERGGGGETTSTTNGDNCKYDNEHSDDDDNNCGGLLLLFMLEQNLLPETPATMDFGIICPHVLSGLTPSYPPPLLSSLCQSILPLLASPSSSPASSILTSVLMDTSSTLQSRQRTRRSPLALDCQF
jgi:hypothetical protein